ncbi:MAG: hypothetical protein EA379_04920 [Phycisphaerales bacterium]|nr:MAG: hypothetical protein EA379_04920 [Phycisphaerales bacterium]
MTLRLGELMVARGLLTEEQVRLVLEEQALRGVPFGALAERMFGVCPKAVEGAWVEQYASIAERVDPRTERVDPDALTLLSARQAWQFRVLPLRFDRQELVVCTTPTHLPRAINFVYRKLRTPSHFVTADAQALGEALVRRYPLAGLTPACVDGGVAAVMSGA